MTRALDRNRWSVRRADSDDARAIASIYNHYVDHGTATFDVDHWSVADTQSRVESPPPSGWYVAEDGQATDAEQNVVGWACVRPFSGRFGYRFTCESAIYLDPAVFGLGVGDALQTQLDAHCLSHQIHHAVARIAANNPRSVTFHQRHGYELVGIQKEIGLLGGEWIDVAIMQKVFDNRPH